MRINFCLGGEGCRRNRECLLLFVIAVATTAPRVVLSKISGSRGYRKTRTDTGYPRRCGDRMDGTELFLLRLEPGDAVRGDGGIPYPSESFRAGHRPV